MPPVERTLLSKKDIGLDCGGRWPLYLAYRAKPAHCCLLETIKENNMKIRIAILAAYVGAFALAQADIALAAYTGAAASKMPATNVLSEPLIVVAQSAAISTTRSNIKRPSEKVGPSAGNPSISDQANGGSLSKGEIGRRKKGDRPGSITLVR
jgi:hypothetical protein